MFGHSLLPVRSAGRPLLGGALCATVVVHRSHVMVCTEEVAFCLDVSLNMDC